MTVNYLPNGVVIMKDNVTRFLNSGKSVLGIELGSTRIKAVLIDEKYQPVAKGTYDWENSLVNGIWTYSLDEVIKGVQGCYASLKADVKEKYGETLKRVDGIGISAMMHGYLAFDENGEQSAEFRTWRNTNTGAAAEELTDLLDFNMPLRWSAAHLYQAVLDREEHTGRIRYMTTLAGYVHCLLTGENVLGIGDAAGMFPIDSETGDYDIKKAELFDEKLKEPGFNKKLEDIFPKVLRAGEYAGKLTEKGALLLDPDGDLEPGAVFCPPEGDAGTGMIATNSITARTGNVSAGTSVFAMVVLEKPLSAVYPEIDMVTTPDGKPVAMVHCNNCTSDINAWADIFKEFAESVGITLTRGQALDKMFELAGKGAPDCGGTITYNYFSGEPITGLEKGMPMVLRKPDAVFSAENFMRSNLYSAMAALKIGMDILLKKENVKIDSLLGHGGFFKAERVGQEILAAAVDTKVSVMKTASEGGAYGIALLAAYMSDNKISLDDFAAKVFKETEIMTVNPDEANVKGFEEYMKMYKKGLKAEKTAVEEIA